MPVDDPRGVPEPQVRALVRAPQSERRQLAAALHALAAVRSARKDGESVRIQVDPPTTF